MSRLLSIRNLSVGFRTSQGIGYAVENFDLDIDAGETLTIVGESGSGKSVAMLAFMGILPAEAMVRADSVKFDGKDWLGMDTRAKKNLIRKQIGMIFQEPFTSLNPCFTVGWQVAEKLRMSNAEGKGMDRREAKKRTLEIFEKVGMPDPSERYRSFPHQLSGGMNQRVMIALAIACNPKLIIADEPTTALDVTIQAQILDLLGDLQKAERMSIILITHDMGVASEVSDRVLVKYAGRKVEENRCETLLKNPSHPYTKALLESLPEANQRERLAVIQGNIPLIHDKPEGCVFHPRCEFRQEICTKETPPLKGSCYCHFPQPYSRPS